MTLYPIGTRVKVVQTPNGRVNPLYVGKTGEVTEHFGSLSHRVRFDDEALSSLGSWSYEALSTGGDDEPAQLVEPLANLGRLVRPGDRVRCIEGGIGFPGRVGTVTDEDFNGPISFRVHWDTLPNRDVNSTAPEHGGTWSLDGLEVIERPDIIDPDDVDGASDDPDFGLPDADAVEEAGLDSTTREAGPYTWEEVARAALARAFDRAFDDNHAQAVEEGAALQSDIAALKQTIREQDAELASVRQRLSDTVSNMKDAERDRDRANKALDYATDRLDPASRSAVFGYLEGLAAQ